MRRLLLGSPVEEVVPGSVSDDCGGALLVGDDCDREGFF